MLKISRIGIARRTADAIHAQIQAARWTDSLPGARQLAEETGVSQPTVLAALAMLAEQGIVSGGPRRAYRLVANPGRPLSPDKPEGPRRAIFATHADLGDLPHTTRRVIDATRSRLIKRGWMVEIRTFDFLHAKRARRSWDHLMPLDPEIPILAVFGRPSIGQWALRHGLPILFLGGIAGDLPVPVVGVRSALLAREAINRLTALGHTRIVMPLCDRPPSFAAGLKDAMRDGLEQAGATFVPSYHTPESDYLTPEVTWRILEAAFARSRPTAFVFLDWKELVTCSCILAKMGLRVPEDVSLVLLNEQMEADWFTPKLTCFRFPVQRLAALLAQWVETRIPPGDRGIMGADFDPGASIAAPCATV